VRSRKKQIQKVLLVSADTQLVTGLAIAIAGLWQVHNTDLSTYHISSIADLLDLSANGQAVVLFYALRQGDPITDRQYWRRYGPRMVIYLSYLGILFAWAGSIIPHFDRPQK
jgi:hypothetical protein